MIRFLNMLQGSTSLILVVVSAILGWPIWITVLGLLIPIGIGLIVFGMEKKSPKGRAREYIEIICSFVFGVGGLILWLLNSEIRLTLSYSTPLWMALTALPSVMFNLGIVVAWVCWIIVWLFGNLQDFFERISGEKVSGKI